MDATADARFDLLRYYAEYFRPGMIDLSASCPPPATLAVDLGEALTADGLAFVPPSGAPDLREAIAARYSTVAAGDVLIAAGASEALAAVALALLGPGARAAVDSGIYASFTEAAKAAGAVLVPGSPLAPDTAVVAVCNPSTPSDRIRDMAVLAAEARAAGAVLAADEVYRDLSCIPIAAAADLDAHAISIGDLSKPLGLGALRIGWVATRDAALRDLLDRQLQLLSGGPSALSVRAALAAFATFDDEVARTMAAATENGGAILRALAAHGWTFTAPEAGLTVLAWPPTAVDAAAEARVHAAGLFLIPCDMYGAPGAYRFGLLAPLEAVRRALHLLAER
ncbi:MAG: aminotransferase class I/II-fold pyridoxal phosphate-dependent enzyme [Dehalococcoidia bacterium]|nr:aminotransferase class I/II-fold pyridoxal phosphate-dependent enzyme [Dehalococcoidia bacterium]